MVKEENQVKRFILKVFQPVIDFLLDNSGLNKNNLFNQLKEIENSGEDVQESLLTEEELVDLRREEKNQLKKNQMKRRIIGILVVIPLSIILFFAFYLLIQALL